MTRKQLERKYEDCGLNDYRLKSLDNLREIHGFDVRELSGYSGLTDENKMLFDKTVLRFYNSLGMDIKKRIANLCVSREMNITNQSELL